MKLFNKLIGELIDPTYIKAILGASLSAAFY